MKHLTWELFLYIPSYVSKLRVNDYLGNSVEK